MARSRIARSAATLALLVTAGALTACSDDASDPTTADGAAGSSEPVVIYSGRNEELVGGLLEQLEEAVGTEVEVRYAGSAELAAQLMEEGEASEADVYFGQDAGALGALARAGLLSELSQDTTSRVDERFSDADRLWVATSARARVIVFDPAQAPEVEQMTSVDDVLDPAYEGKVGYAPTNASFQAFVTALRVSRGEDGAREWLEAFRDNEPQAFENNGSVLEAVESGQLAMGLLNHYYWHELVAEQGADAVSSQVHYLDTDDPGALVNVAGAGVLASSDQGDLAQEVVAFLVSDQAQQYFADETAEYPVVEGISTTEHDLRPLSEVTGASIDLNDLDSLEVTLALLDEVGLT